MTGIETNTLVVQTSPDAAQSVAGAPLCLLSGLAAQAHVGGMGGQETFGESGHSGFLAPRWVRHGPLLSFGDIGARSVLGPPSQRLQSVSSSRRHRGSLGTLSPRASRACNWALSWGSMLPFGDVVNFGTPQDAASKMRHRHLVLALFARRMASDWSSLSTTGERLDHAPSSTCAGRNIWSVEPHPEKEEPAETRAFHISQPTPNTLMVLTNPDAAQSVLRPLCLLSGFAAHQHVGLADSFLARSTQRYQ
jgi:hypothetical protein